MKTLGAVAAILFVLWTVAYGGLLFIAVFLDRSPGGALEPVVALIAIGTAVFVAGRVSRRAWLAGLGVGLHVVVFALLPATADGLVVDYVVGAALPVAAGAFSAWTLAAHGQSGEYV